MICEVFYLINFVFISDIKLFRFLIYVLSCTNIINIFYCIKCSFTTIATNSSIGI